jgi:hypothetical protein
MRKRLKADLYLPLKPAFALRSIGMPPEPQAEAPRYTVERRGNCTILWLGRGESETMIAAFRKW